MVVGLRIPWYCRLSTAGSRVSLGCVCITTAALPSSVAALTPMKTSSITWILATPAGCWLKIVHSWNLPSALSSKEPVDMPTNGNIPIYNGQLWQCSVTTYTSVIVLLYLVMNEQEVTVIIFDCLSTTKIVASSQALPMFFNVGKAWGRGYHNSCSSYVWPYMYLHLNHFSLTHLPGGHYSSFQMGDLSDPHPHQGIDRDTSLGLPTLSMVHSHTETPDTCKMWQFRITGKFSSVVNFGSLPVKITYLELQ